MTAGPVCSLVWIATATAIVAVASDSVQQLRSIDYLAKPLGSDRVRIVVRGVTTLVRDSTAYVQDQTGAIALSVSTPNRLTVGEEVELSGAYVGNYPHGRLEEVTIRPLWSGSPPVPLALAPQHAAEGAFAFRLVETEGRLLSRTVSGRNLQLTLEAGGQVFAATLELSQPANHADQVARDLAEGSWLRLSGVCAPAALPNTVETSAFVILLRSTDDIRVLYGPPWWNLRNVSLLSVAAILALAALYRVRLRVMDQRLNAVVEERLRIAREMHDTLSQVFVGMTWQLQGLERELPAVTQGTPARQRLTQTLQMLRHSQAEVHCSIFALRSLAQVQPDLLELIANSATSTLAGSEVKLSTQSTGEPFPIPDDALSGLLRIGQESITNALKHGSPSRIHVTLQYQSGAISLEVVDDGAGFDSSKAPTAGQEHLGILGMRERARRMSAQMEIISAPGQGTRVSVTVPAKTPRRAGKLLWWRKPAEARI